MELTALQAGKNIMQIFPTGTNRGKGFTLIELILVIFIIALTTTLVMPSFWNMGDRVLKSEAKRIGNTIRYIHDEAAGKKQTYILTLDLDKDAWKYESKKDSRNFKLKKSVMFRDIMIPSLGKVTFGETKLIFSPTGPEEPITLHLIKDDKEYTVMFNHLSGRSKIHEGYVE
jgi:type II secretion system protein H